MKKLNIFLWNVHDGYLTRLVQTGHNFFVPKDKKEEYYGYAGLNKSYLYPKNIKELSIKNISGHDFDLIIFQNYCEIDVEQFRILTPKQRQLPKIFIFHNPPSEKKTKQEKLVRIKKIKKFSKSINNYVQTTKYNYTHWSSYIPRSKMTLIDYGMSIDDKIKWTGKIQKAINATNFLSTRPECGVELFKKVSPHVPVDLIGENSTELGGLGSIDNKKIKKFFANYCVYFNPTLLSSLPTAMLEAMSAGLPVVTASTTVLPDIIKNGYNGFISNDPDFLIEKINLLINDKKLAYQLGQNAKNTIEKKYQMANFIKKWNKLLAKIANLKSKHHKGAINA